MPGPYRYSALCQWQVKGTTLQERPLNVTQDTQALSESTSIETLFRPHPISTASLRLYGDTTHLRQKLVFPDVSLFPLSPFVTLDSTVWQERSRQGSDTSVDFR